MSKVRNVISLYTTGVSKQSIGERTGLPRNSVKKYIRLFLASVLSLESIDQMSDTQLEQLFMEMVPRYHIEDDPRYLALIDFSKLLRRVSRSGKTQRRSSGSNILPCIPMATVCRSLRVITSNG
jgi:hypothetical protein